MISTRFIGWFAVIFTLIITVNTQDRRLPDARSIIENLGVFRSTVESEFSNRNSAERNSADRIRARGRAAFSSASQSPFGFVASFKGGDAESKRLDTLSRELAEIYRRIRQSVSSDLLADLRKILEGTPVFPQCPLATGCTSGNLGPFVRTIDGSCNNQLNPEWGKSNIPFVRKLQPQYGDGIESLRLARDGSDLPSARLVSKDIHNDVSHPFVVTYNHMSFGQFLDHDLDRAPVKQLQASDGTLVDLECGSDGCDTGTSPELDGCEPVPVPPGDPIFGGRRCVKFVRSSAAPNENCELGPREQLNSITAYLDGSMVYGNTDEVARDIRDPDPSRGKLLVIQNPLSSLPTKGLLPQKDVPACRDLTDSIKCFKAGDGRVNEQVGLMMYHTFFVREHNRIEAELHSLNPGWSGETLFQTARRILIAEWQFIVYNEYLPTVLGFQTMRNFNLNLETGGRYYHGYNPSVNAGVSNAFATAAFRFGHSQIPNKLRRTSADHTVIQEHFLTTVFRRPKLLYDVNGPESIALGGVDQEAETVDRHMAEQVNGRMFTDSPPRGAGTDLGMLNNQRGRDHGLPGYNEWREFCGGTKARRWNDFANDPVRSFNLPLSAVTQLRSIYRHPDDVDLFAGGLLEKNLFNSMVGPTFACIIADQFQRSRDGDWFWFENPQAGFTPGQLQEIRKASMARIFCDNADGGIETIQPLTMILPYQEALQSPSYRASSGYNFEQFYRDLGAKGPSLNRRVNCRDLPKMNLRAWAEFK